MRTLFAFLILLLASLQPAKAWMPILRNFTPSETSSGTQNWCVVQLPDGRMLFGNNNGLLIYDGDRWDLHATANYTAVRAIYYDEVLGRIYVGASNEYGYFSSDKNSGSLVYHSLVTAQSNNGLALGEVWNIMPQNGKILFQSKSHIIFYNPDNDAITTIKSDDSIETSAVIDGRLYVATSRKMLHLDHNALHELPGTAAVDGRTVKKILQTPYGILIATVDDGLFCTTEKRLIPTSTISIPSSNVTPSSARPCVATAL